MNIEKGQIEQIVRQVVEREMKGGAPTPQCDLPEAGALKEKFNSDLPTYGMWITLESPTITEMACRLGFDWVVVDAEHGYLDMKNVMEHIRVANLMNVPCLVRIAEIQEGLIKRVMDIGADGIIVPQVSTVEEVRRAVALSKYPPEGQRGIGAERSTRWGMGIEQCVPRANKNSLVISMMETVEAGDSVEQLMDVPGLDGFFFGPHDYSSSAGFPGTWGEPPEVLAKLMDVKDRIRKRGLPCGIVAFDPADIPKRLDEGFRMMGLGFDTGLLIRSAMQALEAAGRKVPESAWW